MTKHKSMGMGLFAAFAACLAFAQTAQSEGVVAVEGLGERQDEGFSVGGDALGVHADVGVVLLEDGDVGRGGRARDGGRGVDDDFVGGGELARRGASGAAGQEHEHRRHAEYHDGGDDDDENVAGFPFHELYSIRARLRAALHYSTQ